jgi:hypothetical protein
MSTVIPVDSPLRRHTFGLAVRQRLLLDGMRYSTQIAELARDRLVRTLEHVTTLGPDHLPEDAFATVLCDAWTIVDSLDRLQRLTNAIPGADAATYVKKFRDAVQPLRTLRNAIQHMFERLDQFVSEEIPTWGIVTWVALEGDPPTGGTIHQLVPGSLYTWKYAIAFPWEERAPRRPIHSVTLEALGCSVELLDAMDAMTGFIQTFQHAVQKQVDALEHKAGSRIGRFPAELCTVSNFTYSEGGGITITQLAVRMDYDENAQTDGALSKPDK